MRRIAIATALVIGLAACSGPDSAGSASRADTAEGAPEQNGGAAPAGLTQVAALGRSQIRAAEVTVHVPDVTAAARSAVRTAESSGGFLESEQTANDRTTVTLRVPPDEFTATGDAIAALGTVVQRTVSTKDVTGDVADVDGRLKAARASVVRVRALLDRASSIQDITNLESELNEREAALESLETRQRALAGQTTFASLTATFTKAPPVVAAPADKGFTDGLRGGWNAFTTVGTVLLVVLGALLPFGAAGAVVGVPLYVVMRRRVSARA